MFLELELSSDEHVETSENFSLVTCDLLDAAGFQQVRKLFRITSPGAISLRMDSSTKHFRSLTLWASEGMQSLQT